MAKKKLSLASALSGAAKSTNLIETQNVSQPQSVVKPGEAERTSLPPSRQGKKGVTGYFFPEVQRQLKAIAFEEDTTIQKLLNEALNDLFVKKGKSPII